MSSKQQYLMENQEEGQRLELKTDIETVKRQAAWAGIKPGMRVLDVGCGTGITTSALAELVGKSGQVTGLDFSQERLSYAQEHYACDNVSFVCHDINSVFKSEQPYDAMWTRFFLEYFKKNQRQVIENSVASLRRGGIACLADLDNNSLGHHGMSEKLAETLKDIAERLERDFDFDLYAGRRLYGHLYEMGFEEICCTAEMHHLVYGQGSEEDQFNWLRKVDVAAQKSGCTFDRFEGGFQEFRDEFKAFLNDPLRFTYTPVIFARGLKA